MSAGLILAAGGSARFGARPKQLAQLGGRPLLQWAVDAQVGVDPARLSPIVLVLGAHASAIRAAVDPGRARVVVCAEWASGQAASLRCGLDALATGADGEAVLVTLGDAPLITREVVARFALEVPPARATYGRRPGHPVLLSAPQVAELRAGAGGDRGARELLHDVRRVEVGHLCSGRDVDTPEDLEEVRDEAGTIV